MNAKNVGLRIQQARLNAGLTQEELGRKLNLSAKYISNLECGSKTAKLATFVAIANALSVDANTLLTDELECHTGIEASKLTKIIEKLPTKRQDKILQVISIMAQDD